MVRSLTHTGVYSATWTLCPYLKASSTWYSIGFTFTVQSFFTSFAVISSYERLLWLLSGKESACQCKRCRFDPWRQRLDLWVRKTPWSRKWQPTPVSLSGKSCGQRCLVGYSLGGSKRVRHDLVTKQQHPVRDKTFHPITLFHLYVNQLRSSGSMMFKYLMCASNSHSWISSTNFSEFHMSLTISVGLNTWHNLNTDSNGLFYL